ncbi:MAG TPA: Uma2 family endonuclease [Thermomicrobiales bacterium]
MSTTTRLYSIDDLMAMPTDQPWELWEGELQKVPGAGGKVSELAGLIYVLLWHFVKPRNLGMLTTADGSYILSHDPPTVVVPDVAFVSWASMPAGAPADGYIPVRPDLAVEVRSPSERPGGINAKLARYRHAGVPLVWWVDPKRRTVRVYRHGELAAELGDGEVLDGEDVLPGFTLPVSDLFN